MTEFAAFSVAPSRAAVVEELRRLLVPATAGGRAPLPFGLPSLDSHLPEGGLPCGGLHEIVPETESANAAAFGFIVALLGRISSPPPPGPRLRAPEWGREKVIFVMPGYGLRAHGRFYGRLSGHGLNALGLDPARVILVETAHRKETLWALAEALHSGAPAAVAGMIDRLDLKTSQKLQLAAGDCGLPLFLLRPAAPSPPSPACGGGWGGGSAAATRWRIGTAEAARDRFGMHARPRWHLHLERCRNGRPGEWVVEYDHVAHRFSLAAALADPALSRGAGERTFGQAGRS
jgi:protein ImuA